MRSGPTQPVSGLREVQKYITKIETPVNYHISNRSASWETALAEMIQGVKRENEVLPLEFSVPNVLFWRGSIVSISMESSPRARYLDAYRCLCNFIFHLPGMTEHRKVMERTGLGEYSLLPFDLGIDGICCFFLKSERQKTRD